MDYTKDIKLAKLYYKRLQCDIEICNLKQMDLAKCCAELNGHNFDEESKLFDVNYGNICTTVIFRNDKLQLVKNVEIWNGDCLIFNDYVIEV